MDYVVYYSFMYRYQVLKPGIVWFCFAAPQQRLLPYKEDSNSCNRLANEQYIENETCDDSEAILLDDHPV